MPSTTIFYWENERSWINSCKVSKDYYYTGTRVIAHLGSTSNWAFRSY